MSSLTERRIRNIEPPATGQLELREGRIEGLSLIVRSSGGKTWRLRYRFRGVPKGIVLGKYPALDVSAARSLALEALRKVHAGCDPALEKREEIKRARTNLVKDAGRTFCDKHLSHNRTGKDQARVLGFRLNALNPNIPDINARWHVIALPDDAGLDLLQTCRLRLLHE